jgi:hypothetical protein
MKARILLATALVTLAALPATAQSIKLSFSGGKVDLAAENATVRAILTEWARVGGTRVVNAERISGPPVTVEFKGAYEQVALESLLRGVAGYMVGQRVTPAAAASSGFDRIVILATSTAPRPAPVTPAVSRPPGPQPLRRLPGTVEENQDEPDANDPIGVAAGNNGPRPETPADLRRRLGQLLENDADNDSPNANEPPPAPTAPANPFGITTGASRPGVITPVPAPRPQQPGQPANPSTQP